MIPDALAEKIALIWGEEGQEWLANFPKTLATLADQWDLGEIRPFRDLSYNFVASAVTPSGEEVVLKVGVPRKELESEAAALQAYDGHGAVRLLNQDLTRGALLLERLRPGISMWETLVDENEDSYTDAAAHVMEELWRAPEEGFPTTTDWFLALPKHLNQFPNGGGIPKELVERALEVAKDLEASSKGHVLLHGDFHHGNVLSSSSGWRAIDPKGVIGPKEFEVGAWIRNPCDRILKTKNLAEHIDRRLRIFAEVMELDLKSLQSWSFCVCILSACWSAEDEGGGWDEAVACALAIQPWL